MEKKAFPHLGTHLYCSYAVAHRDEMMGREYNPSPLVLLVEVTLSAISFAGLLLNALVVLRQRSRRLVILAWAVCNILALAKTPLLVASVHTGHWPAGQVLCSLYLAACTLQMWTGPWLLALAAMNLCIQVSESHSRTRKLNLIECCGECVVQNSSVVDIFASKRKLCSITFHLGT